ncbi:MAG TPA: flagellar basal body-associated FliL family protein [Nevskiaceae bacterium]|nr:flagellar basal body-associated FliL family protein [Nevskiaceae bacterium]
MATSAAAASPVAPAPAAKSSGKLKIILLLVACCAIAGGGAWYFAGRGAHPANAANTPAAAAKTKPVKPPQFVSLGPAFVVNLAGDDALRFLQVGVQLITHDDAVATAAQQLQPELRNRLLLLFSSQHATDLVTRDGKQKLQAEALAEVKAGLKQFHAPTDVNAVIFTSFVMQ